MAGVVKWLTHWIVAPARMGSIPIARPILQGYSSIGRVVVSKTIGCGFKSYCPCHDFFPRRFITARVFYYLGVRFALRLFSFFACMVQ